MESKRSFRSPERNSVRESIDRNSGRYLTDEEAISLISSGNVDELDSVVLWHGKLLPLEQRPIARFNNLLSRALEVSSKQDGEKILKNSFRFVLGDFRKIYLYKSVTEHKSQYSDWIYTSEDIDAESLIGNTELLKLYEGNLASYLLQVIKFSDGKLSKAKELIHSLKKPEPHHLRNTHIGLTTHFLYSGQYANYSWTPDLNGLSKEVEALAFWLSTYLGGFSLKMSNADLQLIEAFKRPNIKLRIEIIDFITESILNGNLSLGEKTIAHFLMRKFASKYNEIKAKSPNHVFVKKFDQAKRWMDLEKIVENSKSGKISPEDLLSLLESNPDLIRLVSEGEIDSAIDVCRDHSVATRLRHLKLLKRGLVIVSLENKPH